MPEKRDVWAALGAVIHPTYGLSLATLEMVNAVDVDGDKVAVELVLDCNVCASREAILDQAHRKLADLVPDGGRIAITLAPQAWSPPWETHWLLSGMPGPDATDDNDDPL